LKCRRTVCRHLQLVEPVVGAGVRLRTNDGSWRRGVVQHSQNTFKIYENDCQLKVLRNCVQIHDDHSRAVTDEGDSGTLVFTAGDPALYRHGADTVEGLMVYGMAVGKVDLPNHTSFTVANRLCDILPAIRNDPRYSELFRGYKELNLCNLTEPDSGFGST